MPHRGLRNENVFNGFSYNNSSGVTSLKMLSRCVAYLLRYKLSVEMPHLLL